MLNLPRKEKLFERDKLLTEPFETCFFPLWNIPDGEMGLGREITERRQSRLGESSLKGWAIVSHALPVSTRQESFRGASDQCRCQEFLQGLLFKSPLKMQGSPLHSCVCRSTIQDGQNQETAQVPENW